MYKRDWSHSRTRCSTHSAKNTSCMYVCICIDEYVKWESMCQYKAHLQFFIICSFSPAALGGWSSFMRLSVGFLLNPQALWGKEVQGVTYTPLTSSPLCPRNLLLRRKGSFETSQSITHTSSKKIWWNNSTYKIYSRDAQTFSLGGPVCYVYGGRRAKKTKHANKYVFNCVLWNVENKKIILI